MSRFCSAISLRRMGLPEKLHQVAPAAVAFLQRSDMGGLLGGAPQLGHAGEKLGRFFVGVVAAAAGELLDALGIECDDIARVRCFARARELLAYAHGRAVPT